MDNRTRAREWQRLAEMDLSSAEYLLNMLPVPAEIICYHCQQSAEKYLKGYLVLHGINPPKIHDLNELRKLCSDLSDTFKEIADQCSDLTAYSVQPRYRNGVDAGRNGYAAGIEQCKSDSRFCSKSCAGDGTGRTENA